MTKSFEKNVLNNMTRSFGYSAGYAVAGTFGAIFASAFIASLNKNTPSPKLNNVNYEGKLEQHKRGKF